MLQQYRLSKLVLGHSLMILQVQFVDLATQPIQIVQPVLHQGVLPAKQISIYQLQKLSL